MSWNPIFQNLNYEESTSDGVDQVCYEIEARILLGFQSIFNALMGILCSSRLKQ